MKRWIAELLLTLASATLFAGAAYAEVTEVQIKLRSSLYVPKRHTHYICELDGATFFVPRRLVEESTEDEPFVLKAPNGTTIGLPWMRHTCREMKVWFE